MVSALVTRVVFMDGGVVMSSELPRLDTAQAHAHFSGSCFHRTWDLNDKCQRSSNEEEQMLLLAMTSLWHWTQ